MMSANATTDLVYTVLYGLSIFGNVLFIFYLVIQRLRTSIDRLIFSLSLVELLLVVFGIPFVYDLWIGDPYKYGQFACRGLVPLHSILDFSETFIFTMMSVFIAEKLRGDQDVQWRVLAFLLCIYVSSIVMVLPYFGVMQLAVRPSTLQTNNGTTSGSNSLYCIEDWNASAEKIYRVTKVLLQFVIPFCVLVYYNRKSYQIVSCIMHYLDTRKGSVRYQSFSKLMSDTQDKSQLPSHLCFTESEEMNLQMNHLYQKHNSISSIRKDEETSKISVQIYTNEVEIDKITPEMPLWRGKRPEGELKQEVELQKTVVSIKWFRYTRNIFQVTLITSIVFIVCIFPFQLLLLYTVDTSPYDFAGTEKLISKVVFCLRFIPALVNPWCFMVGVFKYRKSLFGRCYRQPRNFHVLQDN